MHTHPDEISDDDEVNSPFDFSNNLRRLMQAIEQKLKTLPKESPEYAALRAELDGYEKGCRQGEAGYRDLSMRTFKRTIEQAESQNRATDKPAQEQ